MPYTAPTQYPYVDTPSQTTAVFAAALNGWTDALVALDGSAGRVPKIEAELPFNIRNYGALPNAGFDNTTAINNAAAAAVTAKGVLYIPRGRWEIAGRVTTTASIMGDGQGDNPNNAPSVLVCTAVGAGVTIGSRTSRPRGGFMRDLLVDGARVATNPISVSTVERHFSSVTAREAVGDSWIVDYAANNLFTECLGARALGAAWAIDYGSNWNIFVSCYGSLGYIAAVHFRQSAVTTVDFNFPSNNKFFGGVFERMGSSTLAGNDVVPFVGNGATTIKHDAGIRNAFVQSNLASGSISTETPALQRNIVLLTKPGAEESSDLRIMGCHVSGSTGSTDPISAFRVGAGTVLRVGEFTTVQNVTNVYSVEATGGAASVLVDPSMAASLYSGVVTSVFSGAGDAEQKVRSDTAHSVYVTGRMQGTSWRVTPAGRLQQWATDPAVTDGDFGRDSVGLWTLLGAELRVPHLRQSVATVAAAGTATTLAALTVASIHDVTLTAATCAVTLPAPVAGASIDVMLRQDAVGGRVVTWPATVKWPGDVVPTLTVTPSKGDLITFLSINGTQWVGSLAGQAIAT